MRLHPTQKAARLRRAVIIWSTMKNLKDLIAKIDKELDGLSYTANDRNNFSAALFSVAIEHSKAIIILFMYQVTH